MIDSNTLTYKPYIDPRATADKEFTSGFSGALLLAEDVDEKRYLVKHTFSHNAANEYVACWLAEKMTILCPRADLLTPNSLFRSQYAVAIECIDGFETFDVSNLSDAQKSDVIDHYALAQIVGTSDIVQMRKVGNRLYSYDFSEGFDIYSTDIDILTKDEDAGIDILQRHLSAYKHRSYFVDLPETAELYHIPQEMMRQGLISVGKRLLDITDDEINAMSCELDKLYPIVLSVYYEECIKVMQNKIAQL